MGPEGLQKMLGNSGFTAPKKKKGTKEKEDGEDPKKVALFIF